MRVADRRSEGAKSVGLLGSAPPFVSVSVVGLALVAAAPAADLKAPFAFADAAPLVVSCSELSDGVEVVLRNETATAQTLHIGIGRITEGDGSRRDAKAVCGGLSVEVSEPAPEDAPPPTPVGPGGDAVVTLRANATPTNGKTYASTLAAYGDSGAVARRDLTITQGMADLPTTLSGGVGAVPLIASRDVAHHRADPFDDWVVWLPVKLAESESPGLAAGQTVGALSGERGTAAVTYGDEAQKRLSATTSLVPLRIQKVEAGKYSGKVDLTPDDTATGEVSLSLTASHWWPLALIPLLIGIGIALAVQSINGFWVTRGRLLQRVNDSSTLRDEARARLVEAAQGARWSDFDVSDLDALQDELRAEIGRRTARRGIVIDQKIVDDLGAKIDALESQIGVLDSIVRAAPLLVSAVGELATGRPTDLPQRYGSDLNRDTPRLVGSADALLVGSGLRAADLVERGSEIAAMVTAVRALHKDEDALSHYWGLTRELEDKLDEKDRSEVQALKSRLEGLRHALWDADSANVVDEAVEGFDKVREEIDKLWPKITEPPPMPVPHLRLWRAASPLLTESMLVEPAGVRARVLESMTLGGAWDQALVADHLLETTPESAVVYPTSADGPPPPPRVTPPRPLTEAEASRLITAARRNQWLVLAASVAFAVVTGLSVLYVGKPWGTPWDYVFALAWGMATQAAIATIAGAIGGLGALGALRQGVGRPRVPAPR